MGRKVEARLPEKRGYPGAGDNGGQGGRGTLAGTQPPHGISAPCHGTHRSTASPPRTAPARNTSPEPIISSRPGTTPPPPSLGAAAGLRPHRLVAAVAVPQQLRRALAASLAGALGRAVHQRRALRCRSRVCCRAPPPPSLLTPPRHAAQAPARREPTGSRSNYQLGRLPGPRANTTAPLLNSVGPRSGRSGGDGDTGVPRRAGSPPLHRSPPCRVSV